MPNRANLRISSDRLYRARWHLNIVRIIAEAKKKGTGMRKYSGFLIKGRMA